MLRPDLLCLFLALALCMPFILRLIFRVTHTVTVKETLVNCGILILCALLLWVGGTYSSLSDTQILNGRITDKKTAKVSCGHSYQCMCITVSCGKGCSNQICQTCYEHSYDVDWWAESTLGRFYIDRVNRQGTEEPPRWTAIIKDEPAAKMDRYENYIKAAPDSLFHKIKYDLSKYSYPTYPSTHDYYRINRVINGTPEAEFAGELNTELNNALRDLGESKQVNVIPVLTGYDEAFADALKIHWLGGKKNDVVTVLGIKNKSLNWVRVFSWAKNDIFNVQLRDSLVKTPLDAVKITETISSHIKTNYHRRPMDDFKYLLDDFDPPMWLVVMLLILGLGGSALATFIAHRNEYFYESYYRRY